MTLRDRACKPVVVPSIVYQLYLLITPKHPAVDFPVGDFGLIDQVWTNQ